MANTLKEALAEAAKAGPLKQTAKYEHDALLRVAIELLDPNPWQPRTVFDEREFQNLVDSIRAHGLTAPISVMPKADGRFFLVAGERRSRAYAQLLAEAKTETERQKWATIPALIKLALEDRELAVKAYQENLVRASLTPLEEARVLERMVKEGLARTNEELAALLQQPVIRLKRIRRLAGAPPLVQDALGAGLMVVVGKAEDGTEKRELRRLELLAAIAFIRLHEHLARSEPKKAEQRLEAVLRRALGGGWNLRRIERFVDETLNGRESAADESGCDGESSPAAPLFSRSASRFVVHLKALKAASAEQKAALKAAMAALFAAELDAEGKVQQ